MTSEPRIGLRDIQSVGSKTQEASSGANVTVRGPMPPCVARLFFDVDPYCLSCEDCPSPPDLDPTSVTVDAIVNIVADRGAVCQSETAFEVVKGRLIEYPRPATS